MNTLDPCVSIYFHRALSTITFKLWWKIGEKWFLRIFVGGHQRRIPTGEYIMILTPYAVFVVARFFQIHIRVCIGDLLRIKFMTEFSNYTQSVLLRHFQRRAIAVLTQNPTFSMFVNTKSLQILAVFNSVFCWTVLSWDSNVNAEKLYCLSSFTHTQQNITFAINNN